ncbi:hypothetical protein BN1708_020634, partial [Verticillium longisporum]
RRRVQHCSRRRVHHPHDLRQGVHQGRRAEADCPAGCRACALHRREGRAGAPGQRHPCRGRGRECRRHRQGHFQVWRRPHPDP